MNNVPPVGPTPTAFNAFASVPRTEYPWKCPMVSFCVQREVRKRETSDTFLIQSDISPSLDECPLGGKTVVLAKSENCRKQGGCFLEDKNLDPFYDCIYGEGFKTSICCPNRGVATERSADLPQ